MVIQRTLATSPVQIRTTELLISLCMMTKGTVYRNRVGGSDGTESACNAEDLGFRNWGDPVSIPGLGRFSGEGYWACFQGLIGHLYISFGEMPIKDFLCVGQGGGSFCGNSDGKEFACNAEDLGSIPGSERFPGEENGNPLQYSCLGKKPWTEEPFGLQFMGTKSEQLTLSLSAMYNLDAVWH